MGGALKNEGAQERFGKVRAEAGGVRLSSNKRKDKGKENPGQRSR